MRLDAFQRLAVATTAATYVLIGVGGLVRASGAGLGCPDWPRCFDRWVPPTDASQVPPHIDPELFNFAKAWTEYVNRLVGVTVGFLIFATLVLAVLRYRHVARVLWPTVGAFVFVAFEGWLGGQVVRTGLKPWVLTVHLILALLIVSLLMYATVVAFFPDDRGVASIPRERRWLGRAAIAVSVLLLVQVGIGALVRGEVQRVAESRPRAEWIEGLGWVDILHRNMAGLCALAVLAVVWWVYARLPAERWLRWAAVAALGLVLGQVGAGAGLAVLGFPPTLQFVHLWVASLLLGALTLLALLAYRGGPRGFAAGAAPGRSEVPPREAAVAHVDA